jgi:nucleotide-binding universal stress UspA family protein
MSESPPPYRRILVATDGSEASLHAARQGLQLGRALGAEVTALAVATVDYHAGIHLHEEMLELEQTGQQALDQVEQLGTELGVRITKLLVKGEPGPAIVRAAEEQGFDLLVLGAHRMGRLERVLLGSVSEHVVQNAPVPVLIVRQPPSKR